MLLYPDKVVDVLIGILGLVPRYGGFALRRMSAAAYNKVFTNEPRGYEPAAPVAALPAALSTDTHQTLVLGAVLFCVGWLLSARPPARRE